MSDIYLSKTRNRHGLLIEYLKFNQYHPHKFYNYWPNSSEIFLYFYNKLEGVVSYRHLLLALAKGWCPKWVGKFL